MSVFDKQFQKGSLFLVLFYTAVTFFFIAYAALEPGHRYVSLFLVIIGSSGAWRHYTIWSKRWAQRVMEFIDTNSRER